MDADDETSKRAANVRARAALAGFELHPIDAGRWLLGRWGCYREVRDLDEAERVVERFTARTAHRASDAAGQG